MSDTDRHRRPPLSLSELLIERLYLHDPTTRDRVPDTVLDGLHGAMVAAREAAEQIEATAADIRADPTHTAEANSIRVRDAVLAVAERATRRLDSAGAAARAEIDRAEAAIAAPPAPRSAADLALEQEARTRLASMSPERRRDTVSAAIASGDTITVGAYLRGPAFLTGATETERDVRRASWRQRYHPTEADRLRRLGLALAAMSNGGDALVRYARETVGPAAPVEAADRARQRAEQAVAGARA